MTKKRDERKSTEMEEESKSIEANIDLLAPCGMDCSHCSAYLNHSYGRRGKFKITCPGCLPKKKVCAPVIKRCELLRKKQIRFCYECDSFPCEHIDKLEARYKKRGYQNSFIRNNLRIKEIGAEAFLAEQNKRFTCPSCGGPLSIHEGICYLCGKAGTYNP